MRRVLIVCPHFPPLTAADGHRARMSVPHFREWGWEPVVLAVSADDQPEAQEPALLKTLPSDVTVEYVRALPMSLTRPLGIGNVALRAWRHLDRAGRRLIRTHAIDLVYFSTSMFMAMPLGRVWKRALSVPFVLDMQDPWVNDFRGHPDHGGKHRLASALHARLEPWTMQEVDGLIAVSAAYIDTLRRRYPWIADHRCRVIPFGVAENDFRAAAELPWKNTWFDREDGRLHVVSVGRGGSDLSCAARILFRALRLALAATRHGREPHCWFIGTDYASSTQKTLAPIAAEEGVGALVSESPTRVPFLEGLRLLQASDVLVMLGSDDSAYSPSKVYPYLLARRPLVSVMHAESPVVPLLKQAGHGPVVTFTGQADIDACARRLASSLSSLFADGFLMPAWDDALLAPYEARELTRQQCALFDEIVPPVKDVDRLHEGACSG